MDQMETLKISRKVETDMRMKERKLIKEVDQLFILKAK
jgi:hypothetical protein